MKRVSVTITVGSGSEKHNHDVNYRDSLDHTTGEHDKIIELIPYDKPYSQKINEFMRPFIDERNTATNKRYEDAYRRFEEGKIKNKPKRKDYKLIDYDWYGEHKNDQVYNPHTKQMERKKIWYSWIIGIGDQKDKEKISLEKATSVLKTTVASIQRDFPNFILLGATLHGDEKGFWHMHVDGMPIYYKDELKKINGSKAKNKDLSIGINMDNSLSCMGYKPEQSIMNRRDKAPILFNAMRNQMYKEVEEALNHERILLDYNVSSRKDPNKDSSTNQSLENWQKTRDSAVELQNLKNNIIESINEEDSSIEAVNKTIDAIDQMNKLIDSFSTLKMYRTFKVYEVPFHMFDQMKTTFTNFKQFVSNMIQALYRAYDTIGELKRENNSLLQIIKELKNKVSGYEEIDRIKTRQINDLEEENRNLAYDNVKLSETLSYLKANNKSLNQQLSKISNTIQLHNNQIKK